MRPRDDSRRGRWRPRWRSAARARRAELASAPSAANGAAPDSPIASPRPASARIAACVSASETVIVAADAGQQRRPRGLGDDRRSPGPPSPCPASGSRPARPPPAPPSGTPRRRARRATTGTPTARPVARRRRAQRPDADRHEQRVERRGRARRTASRSRRSPTRAGPDAPTSASSKQPGCAPSRPPARPRPRRCRRPRRPRRPRPRSPRAAPRTERAGRNTRARSPRAAATCATARPWLPALAATSVWMPRVRAQRPLHRPRRAQHLERRQPEPVRLVLEEHALAELVHRRGRIALQTPVERQRFPTERDRRGIVRGVGTLTGGSTEWSHGAAHAAMMPRHDRRARCRRLPAAPLRGRRPRRPTARSCCAWSASSTS